LDLTPAGKGAGNKDIYAGGILLEANPIMSDSKK
jgi:hypothetical protein